MRPRDLGIGHLFERVRDAIIVADAHTGRIVLWNPAATEIFGYSVSEALEMNVEELVPERLRERHERAWPVTTKPDMDLMSTRANYSICRRCGRAARRSASR